MSASSSRGEDRGPPRAPKEDREHHRRAYDEAARLNSAHSFRRRLIFSAIQAAGGALRILDLGSGQGDFLAEARRRFPEAELAGLDASQAGLDRRQAGYESLGVQGAGFPSFNLYKLAVCLRGGRIAQDVDQPQGMSRATALAMAAFASLFRLNRNRWGPGWQTFGVFRAR